MAARPSGLLPLNVCLNLQNTKCTRTHTQALAHRMASVVAARPSTGLLPLSVGNGAVQSAPVSLVNGVQTVSGNGQQASPVSVANGQQSSSVSAGNGVHTSTVNAVHAASTSVPAGEWGGFAIAGAGGAGLGVRDTGGVVATVEKSVVGERGVATVENSEGVVVESVREGVAQVGSLEEGESVQPLVGAGGVLNAVGGSSAASVQSGVSAQRRRRSVGGQQQPSQSQQQQQQSQSQQRVLFPPTSLEPHSGPPQPNGARVYLCESYAIVN